MIIGWGRAKAIARTVSPCFGWCLSGLFLQGEKHEQGSGQGKIFLEVHHIGHFRLGVLGLSKIVHEEGSKYEEGDQHAIRPSDRQLQHHAESAQHEDHAGHEHGKCRHGQMLRLGIIFHETHFHEMHHTRH